MMAMAVSLAKNQDKKAAYIDDIGCSYMDTESINCSQSLNIFALKIVLENLKFVNL